MIPNALSIAGSDPSGGAGIQADLKAFAANGVYGMAAITALTAQYTQGVASVHTPPADFLSAQIDAVFADIRVDAVKIGMIATVDIAGAVAASLARASAKRVVLDPVMVAKSGDRLLAPDAVAALRERLMPLATVITPNLPEAAALLGAAEIDRREDMPEIAAGLLDLGAQAVLLKGGHLIDAQAPDYLLSQSGGVWLEGGRVATRNTHGTGCTLSAALAARLARGEPLDQAARAAKSYISGAIAAADQLDVGAGAGPTHHLHALWPAV